MTNEFLNKRRFQIIRKYPDDLRTSSFIKSSAEDEAIIFADENYIYHSQLTISSANVQYVGFYYCVFERLVEDSREIDYQQAIIDYEASSVYVFVKGKLISSVCKARFS